MKRLALVLLLIGTALAGSHGPMSSGPVTQNTLQPLRALHGKTFDLAWVDEITRQQVVLGGLDDLEARSGRQSGLKKWASGDGAERKAAIERLLVLKNQIQRQDGRTVPVFIGNGSPQDFAHFDGFFLAEYGKASAQLSSLARLGLGKSQNPAVRREARRSLKSEARRLNTLKDLK